MNSIPTVALVGRVNTGKSSLFNRLSETKGAIVDKEPGTTRDVIQEKVIWRGRTFIIWDTAGMQAKPATEIENAAIKQTFEAIKKAQLIIFLVDGKTGPTAIDGKLAELLKGSSKASLLVVNKIDAPSEREYARQFLKFAFAGQLPISAKNGRGIGNLLDKISQMLGLPDAMTDPYEKSVKIAIIGKPNVGKSSLLNALLGYERAVVSSIPHTTRDVVYDYIKINNELLCLLDTAGLRRKAKMTGKRFKKEEVAERAAVKGSFKAINESQIVFLVVDLKQGLTKQDEIIAGQAKEKGKSIIIAANKCDAVPKEELGRYISLVKSSFSFIAWAPVIPVSALKKINIKKLLEAAIQARNERIKNVDDSALGEFLALAIRKHAPPRAMGKKIKLGELRQTAINPPVFSIKASRPKEIPSSYLRFLENRMRETLGFEGTPIKFKISKL